MASATYTKMCVNLLKRVIDTLKYAYCRGDIDERIYQLINYIIKEITSPSTYAYTTQYKGVAIRKRSNF